MKNFVNKVQSDQITITAFWTYLRDRMNRFKVNSIAKEFITRKIAYSIKFILENLI